MGHHFLNDATTLVTALLSTSCCIIQLLLNAFSYSCAGFSIFTPHRSYLTATTFILLSVQFYKNGWENRRVWTTTFLSLLLMMTPELVAYVNTTIITTNNTTTIDSVMLHLNGLGCIACGNRIKNALVAVDWVESASVFFDNSSAFIQYKASDLETNKNNIATTLIQIIKNIDSKYDATLVATEGL
ncbi:hypothetical protein INT45_006220 [Circinella minor]|uniref:HMA domain-containing protein n=1 Tax=Circinella minor TaxID=1195481 RepID=A0A8H7VIX4_9FUNG|nr:hypothetical protein INT45_006220 [Circinella minor]